MPVYCFKCPGCGSQKEVVRPIRDRALPELCDVDAMVMHRDVEQEMGGIHTTPPGNWPLLSDAAGVQPDQIPEAMEHARKVGIPTDFTPDGRAIFTDRGHRKRYCEAIGLYDRSGGYGDPQQQGERY